MEEKQRTEVFSVILKNPSSADENYADRSVNKAERYVYRNFPQCSELRILNLFAYRTTYPEYLQKKIKQKNFDSAVGPGNDRFLKASFRSSAHIIVAWGDPGKIDEIHYERRVKRVHQLLQPYTKKLLEIVSPYPRPAAIWRDEYQCTRYWI